jgi:hypothetical protein
MLTWFIRKRLAAFERHYGYDVTYMRELLATDRRAFFALVRLGGMTRYRRDVPVDAYYAAKLTAALAEDCGPCTQLVVAMALEASVAPSTIAAVLAGADDATPADALQGARFTRAVLAHDGAADELRDEIVKRWGPRALVSIAFGIASGRVYPMLKYALGHGHACARVIVDGAHIVPSHPAVVRRVA